MADVQRIRRKVAKTEAGLSTNPKDRGGLTYAGIAENSWPKWKGWPIVKAAIKAGKLKENGKLPELEPLVDEFYFNEFVMPLRIDEIENDDIAYQVYDMAVNYGHAQAVKMIERNANRPPTGAKTVSPALVVVLNNLDEFLA